MTDLLDLNSFEADFIAGKYDHLLKNLKAPGKKVLAENKAREKRLKEQHKLLESKLKQEKPVEIPKPISLIHNYLVIHCKCCEKDSIMLQQTRIKFAYADGKRFHFQELDSVLEKELGGMLDKFKKEAEHVTLMVEQCSYCVNELLNKELKNGTD